MRRLINKCRKFDSWILLLFVRLSTLTKLDSVIAIAFSLTFNTMLKVKVNLKKKEESVVVVQPQEKLALHNLKKVVAYEDVEEPAVPDALSPKVEVIQPVKKIALKAKVNYTPPPIKIVAEEEEEEEEEEDYSNLQEPVSDSDDEKVMPPLPITKATGPMLVKLNLKKTESTNVVYKSQLLDQKPIQKLGIIKPKLTGQIKLETYYDDSRMYFIHRESGLIFPSDSHLKDKLPDSIGQLVWEDWNHDEDFKDDEKYPLVHQRINWFHYYELDVDAQE